MPKSVDSPLNWAGMTPCLLRFFLALWSSNLSFSDKETITELDEIFPVGTFVSISEMHDAGDRLRLIISGHRRFVKYCYYFFECVFRMKVQLFLKFDCNFIEINLLWRKWIVFLLSYLVHFWDKFKVFSQNYFHSQTFLSFWF